MTAHHNPNGRYRNPQPLPTRRNPPVTYLMPVGSYWKRSSAVDGGDTSYFNKNRHDVIVPPPVLFRRLIWPEDNLSPFNRTNHILQATSYIVSSPLAILIGRIPSDWL